MLRSFLFLFCVITFYNASLAQTVPIGSLNDNTARSLQLMGKLDPSISFTVRPMISGKLLSNTSLYQSTDSAETNAYSAPKFFLNKQAKFSVLPITFIQQFNSHHPYGWNDGGMIAAKGLQSQLSAGIYGSIGPLEVQIQPELVYAANPRYASNSAYGSVPTGVYQQLFPGQSSIRLSAGPITVGVSTENLWWGPGRYSSLLMSNNAPGFLHVFLGTRRPLQTALGYFEWQLIGGKLQSNDHLPYEQGNLQTAQLNPDWRYLNAMVVSYQPKWVPGLFLGFTRGLQQYNLDIKKQSSGFFNQYIPVIVLAFQKNNTQDDNKRTDQLASFFLRWLFLKSKFEFYIEYGFNDYGVNTRDYLLGPSHSAAHIAGVKKIINLNKNEYLDLGFELTQLSQTPDYLVRTAGNWYTHISILQGYTHENQIIGAGAGVGSNVQSLKITWVKRWKQLGLLMERLDHDPVYQSNKWVDLSLGVLPQYKYRNLVFSGKFQFINSSQYAWEKNNTKFNFHSRLAVQYLF